MPSTTRTRKTAAAAPSEPVESTPATEPEPTEAEPTQPEPTEPEPAEAEPAAAPEAPQADADLPAEHADVWAALAAPFSDDEIELLPKPLRKGDTQRHPCTEKTPDRNGLFCGGFHVDSVHLHYVGHAGITTRLNEVVTPAGWSWEPAYLDYDPALMAAAIASGDPAMVQAVKDLAAPRYSDGGLWIKLTVLGTTKLGFGDASGKSGPNAIKEIIGDALRNAAMRFGVGTYLWSKSDKSKALVAQHSDDQPAPVNADEFVAEVEAALKSDNPMGGLKQVWDKYGEDRLRATPVTAPNGEPTTGDKLINGWAAHVRAQETAKAEAERARAAQDAAEEPARDVRADDAQPAQQPAAQVAENTAQEKIAARVAAPEQAAWAALKDELAGQAQVLGVNVADHVRPIVAARQGATLVTDLPIATVHRFASAQRESVIAALREQGRIEEAAAYSVHAPTALGSFAHLTGAAAADTADRAQAAQHADA